MRAIVLAGGGARGAYEMGAWRALRELGVEYQMVLGTSIGAINGVMMVQGDYELAEKLWAGLTLDQVMKNGVNLDFNLEVMLRQKAELMNFLRQYINNRGADISPLVDLLYRIVDERRVRNSGLDFGLTTFKFPALRGMEVGLEQIPQGKLVDYLLASAAIFPAFPMRKIGEELFLDGGYFDNLPINMALRRGADQIIAIDLWNSPTHGRYMDRPGILYIHPSRPLGGMLMFEPKSMENSRCLGYLDTLAAFGRLWGASYRFRPRRGRALNQLANGFALDVLRLEAGLGPRTPFKQLLSAGGGEPSARDTLLRALEIAAGIFDLEPLSIYDAWHMAGELREACGLCLKAIRGADGLQVVREKDCATARILEELDQTGRLEGDIQGLCAAHPEAALAAMALYRMTKG